LEINHSDCISKDLNFFNNNPKLSDFQIKVKKRDLMSTHILVNDQAQQAEYEIFKVHKVILASRCQTFFNQFCGAQEWSDSWAKEVKHDEFDTEAMRQFIHYVYSGKLRIELSNVVNLI